MNDTPKPNCELIGKDGNIFNLIGLAQRTLHEHGLDEQANELWTRINSEAEDYNQALSIIGEYVNITGPEGHEESEEISYE